MFNLAPVIRKSFSSELMEFVEQVSAAADHAGQRAVLVGGVVRDMLVGRSVKDADIMLEAPLDKIVQNVAQKYHVDLVSHPRFLTFTIAPSPTLKVDFVTAREETYRAPSALPDVKASSIEKDFRRRDFTINAMACWINKPRFGELLDPLQGKADLDRKTIRVLHPLSFQDDPTRIFRAARFAGRLNFKLEKTTRDLIEKAVQDDIPAKLSPARRRREWEMVLLESDPVAALELLNDWGALSYFYRDCRLTEHQKTALRENTGGLGGQALLVHRLKQWFNGMDAALVREIMDGLQFERDIKSAVV